MGDPAATGRASSASESNQALDIDLPCYNCGYNLRKLARDGNCPECGYAISKSTSLGVIKQWPLTAENACGWLSLGVLTCWIFGLGIILWLLGLGLLLRQVPGETSVNRWANRASWITLLLLGAVMLTSWVFPSISQYDTWYIVVAILLAAHYLSVMQLGLRLARDAKMPFAYGVTLLLMLAPFLGILFSSYGFIYGPTEESATLIIISTLLWFILNGFYWMGISGELGTRRLELTRRAANADRRTIKTKSL